MTKLFSAITQVLRMYPAISAAVLNAGVAVAAYAGFHITGEQLIYVISAASVLFGLLVHSNVTPVAKIKSVKPDVTVTYNGL
jgi:hypothetical protein